MEVGRICKSVPNTAQQHLHSSEKGVGGVHGWVYTWLIYPPTPPIFYKVLCMYLHARQGLRPYVQWWKSAVGSCSLKQHKIKHHVLANKFNKFCTIDLFLNFECVRSFPSTTRSLFVSQTRTQLNFIVSLSLSPRSRIVSKFWANSIKKFLLLVVVLLWCGYFHNWGVNVHRD